MSADTDPTESLVKMVVNKPTRPTEVARLKVAQLTIESGLTLDEVFQETCRIVSETLHVERIGVWLMLENQEGLRSAALYEASCGEFSDGTILLENDFPTYFAALGQRKILPAEAAQHDPLTSELVECYLKPLAISSVLDAPILVGGNVAGVVCCEHVGPAREWTTEERDFVASIADLLATKIRAAEVQQLRKLMQLSECRILASEKSDALAKMALGVSHDFRNILTVIQNCTETLRASEPNRQAQDLTHLILDAVQRGADTVRALADFGREGKCVTVVVDPAEEILAFMPILKAALSSLYRIDLQIEPGAGKILIDRNRLQRVLLNLIMNAKEALQHGGTIDLKVSKWKASGSPHRERLAIEVRDHGVGMDLPTQERIFEPFFTTKSEGSGLGLPIVARIVQAVGGTVEVESKLRIGTTIRLVFPVVAH
jgi:two-component system, cell cycle sensor histidine kinase and response regulator CckA